MIPQETIKEILDKTDIVQIVGESVELKKTGTDYFGLCPFHKDGDPSFSVSVKKNMFFCFGCNEGGSAVDFLMKHRGMDFLGAVRDLASRCGVDVPKGGRGVRLPRAPRPPKAKNGREWRPEPARGPINDQWREKAGKYIEKCHGRLMDNEKALRRLRESRGLLKKTVARHRLGYQIDDPRHRYRHREPWGLPERLKKNGKKKRLYLPPGLVIPQFDDDGLVIGFMTRRPPGMIPKYLKQEGSAEAIMGFHLDRRALVVVESWLDAILLVQEVKKDLFLRRNVGVVALGSSSAKPDSETYKALQAAAVVINSLDFDGAGAKASLWWAEQFPRARLWPVPAGKDPGEFKVKHGGDLVGWIRAALPVGWNPQITQIDADLKTERHENIPETVLELAELLRESGTVINKAQDHTGIEFKTAWERRNDEKSRRLSQLVYFDPDVAAHLAAHSGETITPKNIIVRQD